MKMSVPPHMGHFSFSTCPERGNGCSQQSLFSLKVKRHAWVKEKSQIIFGVCFS